MTQPHIPQLHSREDPTTWFCAPDTQIFSDRIMTLPCTKNNWLTPPVECNGIIHLFNGVTRYGCGCHGMLVIVLPVRIQHKIRMKNKPPPNPRFTCFELQVPTENALRIGSNLQNTRTYWQNVSLQSMFVIQLTMIQTTQHITYSCRTLIFVTINFKTKD